MEDIYTVCSHGGEESPGIFLWNIYTSCIITEGSSLTRMIPFRNIHTPYVVKRVRVRRVYSYTEYKRRV